MREMRRMAWTDCVIPTQDAIAAQLTAQLLRDFEDVRTLRRTRVVFDRSRVPALMEDQVEKHARVRADYLAGLITRATAKAELGYPIEPDGSDNIYAQPTNVFMLRPGEVAENSNGDRGGQDVQEEG